MKCEERRRAYTKVKYLISSRYYYGGQHCNKVVHAHTWAVVPGRPERE